MIKRIGKKIIVCLMVFLLLFNFLLCSSGNISSVYADDEITFASNDEEFEKLLESQTTGLASIITSIFTTIPVMIGNVFLNVTYSLLAAGQGEEAANQSGVVSPYEIFFNEGGNFPLLNINIFETSDVSEDSAVYNIRTVAIGLFTAIETICILVLFIILIIQFTRRFMANTPDGKKNAYDAIIDCVYSIVLVLFIDIIIIAILRLNELLMDALSQFASSFNASQMISVLQIQSFSKYIPFGIGCCIAYVALCVLIFAFAVKYIIRFFVVTAFIVISPIMALFYNRSKAREGNPGAFNRWFKILLSNILIQAIDGLLYSIFALVGSFFETGSITGLLTLGATYLYVIALIFIFVGEKTILVLFGMDNSVVTVSNMISGTANIVRRTINSNTSTTNTSNNPVSYMETNTSNNTSNNTESTSSIRMRFNNFMDNDHGLTAWTMNLVDRLTHRETGLAVKDESPTQVSEPKTASSNETSPDTDSKELAETSSTEASTESEKNSNEESKETIETHEEEVREKETNNNKSEVTENSAIPVTVLSDAKDSLNEERARRESLDEFKVKYTKLLDDLRNKNNLGKIQKDLDASVENLNKVEQELTQKNYKNKVGQYVNLDTARLRDDLQRIYQDKGRKGVEDYYNLRKAANPRSVEKAEADYAKAFLDYIDKQEKVNLAQQNSIDDLMRSNEAEKIFNEDELKALINNAQNIAFRNGVDASSDIFNKKADEINNSIKTLEDTINSKGGGTQLDVLKDQALLYKVYNNDNMKKIIKETTTPLEVFDGKIDVSYEYVSRIAENFADNQYTDENFEKIMEKVRKEGDEAVKNVNEFCDAKSTKEATKAARKLNSDAQKSAVRFYTERKIGSMFAVAASTEYAQQSVTNENQGKGGASSNKNTPNSDMVNLAHQIQNQIPNQNNSGDNGERGNDNSSTKS